MDTRIVGKDSNSGLTIIYYTLIVRFIFYIACITQGKILIGLMTFELMLLPFEIFAIRLIASDLSQIVKKLQDLKPTERPIHCSDKDELHFYIKDQNVWVGYQPKLGLEASMRRLVRKRGPLLAV